MEYIILILFAALMSFSWRKKPNHERLSFGFFVIFVYSILLWGFRYRVGIDTLNYMEDYAYMPSLNKLELSHIFEYKAAPFYTLLVATCKSISSSFYLLQIAVTSIFNLCLLAFIKRHSNNPFHAFLIFFFMNGGYFNTEILRESLSVGIFLLNLDNLLKGRWTKYYLLAMVSLMFHYSGIIIFVFPFFKWLKLDTSYLILIAVFFFVSKQLSEILLPLVTFEAVSNRLNYFSAMMENGQLNINWVIVEVIRTSFLPFCLLLVNKFSKWKLDEYEFLICLLVLFGLGSIYFEIIFNRFCNYIIIIFAVCFSNLLTSKILKSQYSLALLIAYIGIYSFYYINHQRFRFWYPYVSILKEHKVPEREKLWFVFFPYK